MNFNSRALVVHIPLFKFCDEEVIDFICQHLEFEAYLANDQIMRSGTLSRGLFLVARGTVKIESSRFDYVTQTLHDGDFFGELSLVLPKLYRPAKVHAVTPCHLYLLSHDTLHKTFKMFTKFRNQFSRGFIEYYKNFETKVAEVPQNILDLVQMESRGSDLDIANERTPSQFSRQTRISRISEYSKKVQHINTKMLNK